MDTAAQEIPTNFYDGQSGCPVNNSTWFAITSSFREMNSRRFFTGPEDFSSYTEFDSIVMGNPVHAATETYDRWIGESCSVVAPV